MHLFALSYLSLLWKWLWLSEIIALKARKLFLDVALNHCVSKFLQKKPRLRRAIVHWPSWTDFYSVKRPLLNRTIYCNLVLQEQTVYAFSSACANYYRGTMPQNNAWNIPWKHVKHGETLFLLQHILHSRRLSIDKIFLSRPSLQ